MSLSSQFCNHYRAMSDHDTCEAGVKYEDLKHLPFEKRPCFRKETDKAPRTGCDLMEFPTAEQLAEIENMMELHWQRTILARDAILLDIGTPWKKGSPGAQGEIDCPVCKTGKLRYSQAGYNGHIHAACSTEDCVRWME